MKKSIKLQIVIGAAVLAIGAGIIYAVHSRAQIVETFKAARELAPREAQGVKYWEFPSLPTSCGETVSLRAGSHSPGVWVTYPDGRAVQVYHYQDYIYADRIRIDDKKCQLLVEIIGFGAGIVPTHKIIVFGIADREVKSVIRISYHQAFDAPRSQP